MDDEPRLRSGDQGPGGEHDAQPALAHQQMETVIGFSTWALPEDVGDQPVGWAEEDQGLVDQVRAEIEEQAAAWFGMPPPAIAHLGPVPIVAALIADHLSQIAATKTTPQCQEIAVPAPVVEHRQQTVAFLGH